MTASAPADPVIPVWLRRTGAVSWRLLVIVALAAVTIWAAVVLGTVTVSILLALVVAASFAPLVLQAPRPRLVRDGGIGGGHGVDDAHRRRRRTVAGAGTHP